MRAFRVVLGLACCALLASACSPAAPAVPASTPAPASVGPARAASFLHGALQLTQSWDAEVAAGVPAASLLPLRQQLAASVYETAPATAALWSTDDGSALLGSLNSQTAGVWVTAWQAADDRATGVIDGWTSLVAKYGNFVPSSAMTTAAAWPGQLAAVPTPAAIDKLVAGWSAVVTSAQQAAAVTQAAADKLAAELQPYSSIDDLVTVAAGAVATARADSLVDPDVPGLLGALRSAASGGGDPGAAISALQGPLHTLRALIGQQNSVAGSLASLHSDIDNATAMGTTHAAGFPPQYDALAAAFHAASDSASLSAVGAQIAALDNAVNNDPLANGCGRAVGAGKVIAISLSRQSVTFYQDGCVVRSSLVTTGRPALPTPTGTFHIMAKYTQFTFISPWPPSSPYYYYPSLTNYAMLFAAGGYFIHDAPWEPTACSGREVRTGPRPAMGACTSRAR
jgi:lipoprotein-anchoring transpeptidase ErfK/SrfK